MTTGYTSSLSDKEWEIFEPLLLEILLSKKQTRPPAWTKREIVDGILYQLKNGFIHNGKQNHLCKEYGRQFVKDW